MFLLTRTRNDRCIALSHLIHEEKEAAEHKSLLTKFKKKCVLFSHIRLLWISVALAPLNALIFISFTAVQALPSLWYISPHRTSARWGVKILTADAPCRHLEPHSAPNRPDDELCHAFAFFWPSYSFFWKQIGLWKSSSIDVGSWLGTTGVKCIVANHWPLQPLPKCSQLSYYGMRVL